jgi:hypothetical protein
MKKDLKNYIPKLTLDSLFKFMPLQPEIKELLLEMEKISESNYPLVNLDFWKQEEFKPILKIADQVAFYTKYLNPVELFTVDNVNEIKQDFLKKIGTSKEYNPQFTYQKSLSRLDKTLQENKINIKKIKFFLESSLLNLKDLSLKNWGVRYIRYFLRKKIQDELVSLDLYYGLKEKDSKKVKKALEKKYPFLLSDELLEAVFIAETAKNQDFNLYSTGSGVLDKNQIKFLKQVDLGNNLEKLQDLEKNKPENRKYYYNAEEIKEAFLWVLNKYYDYYETNFKKKIPKNLKYKFHISSIYSDIDVRDKSSSGMVICIPKDRVVDTKKLLELLSHEIESHCRQSLNGVLLFYVGGGTLKIDEETLYEGLAIDTEDRINKDIMGIPSRIPEPYYILSIKLAYEGKTFLEVFHNLKLMLLKTGELRKLSSKDAGFISDNLAWKFTYRVFRGHFDTANQEKFAMAKDMGYFRGVLLQKQLREYGLDYINSASILRTDFLKFYARFKFTEKDLPFPFLNITKQYFLEITQKRLPCLNSKQSL